MIRFSAFLVVVAVGLLVAGVVTSKLLLVYIAIGVSGVALLALGIGAAVNWRELTSKTAQPETVESSAQGPAAPQASVPEPAPAAASAVPAPSGPSRAGYLPATEPPPRASEPPPRARPAAAPAPAAPPPEPSAPGVWEWRDDSLETPAPPTSPHPTQKPAPEPEAPGDHAPASEADLNSEPELTLVPGTTVVTATSQAKQPEQDRQPEQGMYPEQDKQAGQAEPAGPDPAMEVTVVPGVPRYHKARCILIRFMGDSDLDKMTLAAAREAGCTPCRACLPDQPGKSPE